MNMNLILLRLQRSWRGIFRPVFGGKKTYDARLTAVAKMDKLWAVQSWGVFGLSYFRTFPEERRLLVFYSKIGCLMANFYCWIFGP